jgi:hypothetical protein
MHSSTLGRLRGSGRRTIKLSTRHPPPTDALTSPTMVSVGPPATTCLRRAVAWAELVGRSVPQADQCG